MEATEIKESALQILDEKEASLIELSQKFKGLKIKGTDDKAGYKLVREARIALKKARVQIEHDGEVLRENAVRFSKRVIQRQKELIKIIEPAEWELSVQEEEYEKALEVIRIEKEREEKARIQNRITALAKFNYALDLYEVTTMPDDKFNELLTQVEIDFNKEQERIAAEKAETERMRNEEAVRLRAEREALAKQKAEQEAKEAEIRASREKLERDEKERQEFARQQEAEKQAWLKGEQERITAEREQFEKEKRAHGEAIRLEQAKKEAAERARIEEQERIKREELEKIERERIAKIEAERQEALKPDKEKLYQYAKAIAAIPVPDLKHKDAKKIINSVSGRVNSAVEFIYETINEL